MCKLSIRPCAHSLPTRLPDQVKYQDVLLRRDAAQRLADAMQLPGQNTRLSPQEVCYFLTLSGQPPNVVLLLCSVRQLMTVFVRVGGAVLLQGPRHYCHGLSQCYHAL